MNVSFNFSLTNTKELKNDKTQPFLFRIYVDILMSQFGLVKTIRLFRTMPKQYEFSTIQGMSTDITLQTSANTHKHHSYTPITPTPPHPSPTSDMTRHIQTTKEANTYQQTPADVNRHFQASAILKQHLGGSGDVRECLLVQLVSVDFN